VYDGYVYRTLTGLLVDGDDWVCENQWTETPDGWESSSYNSAIVNNVVYTHHWNTGGLVFEGRNGYYNTNYEGSERGWFGSNSYYVLTDGNRRRMGGCNLAMLLRRKC